MLVWIDLETTGLCPQEDCILEAGMIITTDDLSAEVFQKSWVVKPKKDLSDLHDQVRRMHEASGLLAEVDSGFEPGFVAVEMAFAIEDHGAKGEPLCGSSVHFDRNFLRVHMPAVWRRLHYRNIDVSTLWELGKRWGYDVRSPEKAHRTLADLDRSIGLLKACQRDMFVPCVRH